MKVYDSILQTIGHTPLVRLNTLADDIQATVLAKVEYFNPGQSVKDRIAIKMIEDAEKEGYIKPGGTIIEGTSGNTGMGLAIAAIIKGYHCIFTTTDKQSKEKIDLLRALGAEVRICPTNVDPEDPRSYYSVAQKLSEEIPNSYYPNQYDNPSNAQAHYETTGPELWDETEGKITHFVAGMGTCGTVTGAGRFLKEKDSDIKVIGIDSVGSVFKEYFETGSYSEETIAPYFTEGIGEDLIPGNYDESVMDEIIQVNDRNAFLTTRALAKREGLFVGGSCGAAVYGALDYARQKGLGSDDVVVVILPDSGTRYISKIYNDEWMKENNFMSASSSLKAIEIVRHRAEARDVVSVPPDTTLQEAIDVMNENKISQLPVVNQENNVIGSLTENRILNRLIEDAGFRDAPVSEIMDQPFPVITGDMRVDQITQMLKKNTTAVIVKHDNGQMDILTKSDIIHALSHAKSNEV